MGIQTNVSGSSYTYTDGWAWGTKWITVLPKCTPPEIPKNVKATVISDNEINISWDGVAFASGYDISLCDGTYLGYTTNFVFHHQNLKGNTKYSYKISAQINTQCFSGFTSCISATTTNKNCTPPSLPVNVKALALSDSEIEISWDPVSGATDGYDIFYCGSGVLVGHSSSTSLVNSQRVSNTNYSYTVRARNSETCYSEESKCASAITKTTACIAPPVPVNIKVSNITETECDLSWDISDKATGYDVAFCDGTYIKYTDKATLHLYNLMPSKVYSIKVSAQKTSQCYSQASACVDFKTKDPVSTPVTNSSQKKVFGWYDPHAKDNTDVPVSYYQWDKLTDISYFGYYVNESTGKANNYSDIDAWESDPVIAAAKLNKTNLNLCVILQTSKDKPNVFKDFFDGSNSSAAQNEVINGSIQAAIRAGATGINIDFEGYGNGYANAFLSFVKLFRERLNSTSYKLELSADFVGSQASGSNPFVKQFDPYLDLFMIMAYDYYSTSGSAIGPSSPLYSYSSNVNNVSDNLNSYINAVSEQKVILAVPYYGCDWPVEQGCDFSGIGISLKNAHTYDIKHYINTVDLNRTTIDEKTFTRKYCYFNEAVGYNYVSFFDDPQSYQHKYDVIKQRGIAGVGIWRLGNDYSSKSTALWDLLNDNFKSSNITQSSGTIYDMGGPLGNYHKNEKYTFTIAPKNAVSLTLNFKKFGLAPGDYLKIYDGSSTSTLIGQPLTGSQMPSSSISTSSGSVTIEFYSASDSKTDIGFEFDYNSVTIKPPSLRLKVSSINNYEDVNLTLDAAQEFGKSIYQLERSEDGKQFKIIDKVIPFNDLRSHVYKYRDRGALNKANSDAYFYRYRIINCDSTVEYTNNVKVNVQRIKVSLKNTLFDDRIFVNTKTVSSANLRFELIDLSGRSRYKNVCEVPSGDFSLILDKFSRISTGVYILRITDGKSAWTFKVFKL
jgi:spore germination protein YaaH